MGDLMRLGVESTAFNFVGLLESTLHTEQQQLEFIVLTLKTEQQQLELIV
jgi:hypothetical protein